MAQKFLSVIVRSRDEPYIEEFVDHYFHEGADQIYIVEDNVESDFPASFYKNDRITIIKAQSWQDDFNHFEWSQMMDVNLLFEKIRSEYEWFISVDADEFITTKRNYERTIREELKQTFTDQDCIKVPWVMMASGGLEKDPEKLLTTLDHRWDHDKRHPSTTWGKGQCRYEQIDVKCIFRPSNIAYISTHYPVAVNDAELNVVDGIRGEPTKLNYYH
ncbi:MAG: glycosyltransferase family 2 protein, partial [Chloroflexota bacterium]